MRRLLVVSDLHAFTPSKGTHPPDPPSLLRATRPSAHEPDNMIRKIGSMIKSEGLEIDAVLCPGDLADKADQEAQRFAWEELNWLKDEVGAKYLIGTAGNHDLDSRLVHSDFDPKGNLLGLIPPFPGPTDALSDKYWAQNFSVFIENGVRIVNLNSAAFHGYASEAAVAAKKLEYLHGRVSDGTIRKIVAALSEGTAETNILLTHHHIYRSEHIYAADYSQMEGAGKLVDEISKATDTSWLVIHGHQHYPSLSYGMGSALPPVILSAGSATAIISGEFSSSAPNQIYYIELAPKGAALDGWSPCGLVRGWHWGAERAWEPSPSVYNIPATAGFGCKMNASQAADAVERVLDLNPGGYIQLRDAFGHKPELRYILPAEMDRVLKELSKRSIVVTRTYDLNEATIRRIGA